MKRTIGIVCIATIAVLCLAGLYADYSKAESVTFEDGDYTYEVCPDVSDSVKITDYNPKVEVKDLVLPDSVVHDGNTYHVVAIGYNVLRGMDVEKVTVGDSCISIGPWNFYDCPFLKEVVLGNQVQVLEFYCISGCPSLTKVTLSPELVQIRSGSFINNDSLNKSGIDTNGNPRVFFDDDMMVINTTLVACIGMTDVVHYVMDDTITTIAPYALMGQTKLVSVDLSDDLTTIGSDSFSFCTSLESVVFGDSLIAIDSAAFEGCTSLKSVSLPTNLRMVDSDAFYGCTSLMYVYMDYNVVYIGNGAFAACEKLDYITIDDYNTHYICVDGILYQKKSETSKFETIVQFLQGYKVDGGVLDLSNNVTLTINTRAFSFSDAGGSFTKVILPRELQEIEYSAFERCYGLEYVDIPGSVSLLDYAVFYDCVDLKTVVLHDGTDDLFGCFMGCTSLENIELPSSVTYIGSDTFFGCTSLKSLTLPDCEVTLCMDAIFGCTSLKTITIPNAKTILEEDALLIDEDTTKQYELTLIVASGFDLPDNACGTTHCNVQVIGEQPYPYENWIVIVIVVMIMLGLLRFIRRV